MGHPSREHETARKLVAWKLKHKLLDPARYADLPMVFHYVNVGPTVQEHEAITDVCLPLA